MSMQKAQPLICEARVLTSSTNDFSSPHSSTYFCNEYIARKAPGAAFSYFKCVPISFSSENIHVVTNKFVTTWRVFIVSRRRPLRHERLLYIRFLQICFLP